MRNTIKVLDVLQEEAAELIVAISKLKRFGVDSRNPLVPDSPTNLENMLQEIGDILAMVEVLMEDTQLPITVDQLYHAKQIKLEKLKVFLPHE